MSTSEHVIHSGCVPKSTSWHYFRFRRRQPDWWRQTAYSGTKLLYQPEPKPVVYIIPVKDILGRLALVPFGVHGTIPHAWRQQQGSHYPRGVCDRQDRVGSGSKLFYINSWAMIWSSDQPRTGREDKWALLCTFVHLICFDIFDVQLSTQNKSVKIVGVLLMIVTCLHG